MKKANFLREYKGITINLGDESQKKFVMDLLMQVFYNNFEYEYNGEKLNIVDLNDREENGIHIILQNAGLNTIKKRYKKPGPKPGSKYKKGTLEGNVIVTGYIPERFRIRYKLSEGEKFNDLQHLADYLGLAKGTLYNWLNKKWIEIEKTN